MNHNGIFSLSFPEAKTIIVSGDIHGNFNQLVFKLCIQYQLTDTLLIVAGDCGFGFEKKEYYEQIVRRNAKRMNQANNWICLCEAIMIILLFRWRNAQLQTLRCCSRLFHSTSL